MLTSPVICLRHSFFVTRKVKATKLVNIEEEIIHI